VSATLDRLADLLHRDFAIPRESLVPEATLESLQIDSLRMIEILFSIEDEFGISVPDEASQEMKTGVKTLGDLAQRLEVLAGGSAKP
jgi:acyl carrier protein